MSLKSLLPNGFGQRLSGLIVWRIRTKNLNCVDDSEIENKCVDEKKSDSFP